MIFDTKRVVENNVFTTIVSFTDYGTEDGMTAKQEQALFNDLGNPTINLGSIVFKGFYKVDGDKRVITATEADGDEVSFIVNAKRYELVPGFSVSYSVDASDVPNSELGEHLTTGRLVAEAKALLFQEKVYEAITNAVSALKAQRTRFESEVVATLSV